MRLSPQVVSTVVSELHDCNASYLEGHVVRTLGSVPHYVHTTRLSTHPEADRAFSWVGLDKQMHSVVQTGLIKRASDVFRASRPAIQSISLNDIEVLVQPNAPKILVIEDEPSVLSYIGSALEMKSYEVTSCENAESALVELGEREFDVALTDCRLPGMQGSELAADMGARYPDVPVIGMSGEHFKGDSMLEAGAVSFIEKPLVLTKLWSEVERVLEYKLDQCA